MSFEGGYFEDVYDGNHDARNPSWKTRPLVEELLRHRGEGRPWTGAAPTELPR